MSYYSAEEMKKTLKDYPKFQKGYIAEVFNHK